MEKIISFISEILVDVESKGRVCIHVLKCLTVCKNEHLYICDKSSTYVSNMYTVDVFFS